MSLEGSPLNVDPTAEAPTLPRMFLFEPGWRVGMKVGSEREYCYSAAPGQNYYHRLVDGELYLYHADEKICIPCAGRRGLLNFEPRPLRDSISANDLDTPEELSDYEVEPPRTE